MKVSIGFDHGALNLRSPVIEILNELQHQVTDHGTDSPDSVDYPDYARLVAEDLNPGGECVLVNWRGETGLPLSGEEATDCFLETLEQKSHVSATVNEKHDGYVLQVYRAEKPLY